MPPRTVTDDDLRLVGVEQRIIDYLVDCDLVTRAEFYDLALIDLMEAPQP